MQDSRPTPRWKYPSRDNSAHRRAPGPGVGPSHAGQAQQRSSASTSASALAIAHQQRVFCHDFVLAVLPDLQVLLDHALPLVRRKALSTLGTLVLNNLEALRATELIPICDALCTAYDAARNAAESAEIAAIVGLILERAARDPQP